MEKLTVVGNDRKKMKYIVDDILDKAGIDCDWESDTEFAVKTEDLISALLLSWELSTSKPTIPPTHKVEEFKSLNSILSLSL